MKGYHSSEVIIYLIGDSGVTLFSSKNIYKSVLATTAYTSLEFVMIRTLSSHTQLPVIKGRTVFQGQLVISQKF